MERKWFKGNRKGAFSALKLLIGIILFSLFVVVLGGFYVSMMDTYNVPVSEKYQSSYDNLGKMTNISTSIGEQLQGGKLQDTNTLILAGQSVYSVGQIILNAITLPYKIISEFQANNEILEFIHPAFFTALVTILVLVITWSAFALFARWVT